MGSSSRFAAALAVLVSFVVAPRIVHAAHHEPYPIKADDFRDEIEKKIARTQHVIDKKLERAGVSAARRIEVRHLVDDVSRDVKNALDRATADGNITRDEAIDVRNLAKGLRGKVRARLRAEKAEGHEHRTAKKDKAKGSAKDKAKDDKKDDKRDEARASKKESDPYGAEAQPSSS